MKKALTIIGICCFAILIVIGIYYSIPPKTLDFRGTVYEIKTDGENFEFHIKMPNIASYTVIADNKTKVSYCHKNDPKISLNDIKIGDEIEGNYRKFQKENKAKFITVFYHN